MNDLNIHLKWHNTVLSRYSIYPHNCASYISHSVCNNLRHNSKTSTETLLWTYTYWMSTKDKRTPGIQNLFKTTAKTKKRNLNQNIQDRYAFSSEMKSHHTPLLCMGTHIQEHTHMLAKISFIHMTTVLFY
jgi:hypothetical protein